MQGLVIRNIRVIGVRGQMVGNTNPPPPPRQILRKVPPRCWTLCTVKIQFDGYLTPHPGQILTDAKKIAPRTPMILVEVLLNRNIPVEVLHFRNKEDL